MHARFVRLPCSCLNIRVVSGCGFAGAGPHQAYACATCDSAGRTGVCPPVVRHYLLRCRIQNAGGVNTRARGTARGRVHRQVHARRIQGHGTFAHAHTYSAQRENRVPLVNNLDRFGVTIRSNAACGQATPSGSPTPGTDRFARVGTRLLPQLLVLRPCPMSRVAGGASGCLFIRWHPATGTGALRFFRSGVHPFPFIGHRAG